MNILIIGLPNGIKEKKIPYAMQAFAETLGIEDVNITAKMIKTSEIEPKESSRSLKEDKSPFQRAVTGILENMPCDISDSISFRSWFYSKVLDGTILRPVLEVLAMGPVSSYENKFLASVKLQNLPEYAKVAISMLMQLWERRIKNHNLVLNYKKRLLRNLKGVLRS